MLWIKDASYPHIILLLGGPSVDSMRLHFTFSKNLENRQKTLPLLFTSSISVSDKAF